MRAWPAHGSTTCADARGWADAWADARLGAWVGAWAVAWAGAWAGACHHAAQHRACGMRTSRNCSQHECPGLGKYLVDVAAYKLHARHNAVPLGGDAAALPRPSQHGAGDSPRASGHMATITAQQAT
eukprot:354629-Chlamydomonas_euryale.AAC.6